MLRIIIIVLLVIVLVAILYYVFGGKSGSNPPSDIVGCPSSFVINQIPYLGQIGSLSITYSVNNGKYYQQDSGSLAGYSGQLAPKEITKDVFMEACKQYQSGSK